MDVEWELDYLGFRLRGGRYTYKPAEDTLAIYINLTKSVKGYECIYDVGVGSGILAMLSSREGVYSIGIDILWEALRDAWGNILSNGVDDGVDLVLGDLATMLRLDVEGLAIVSNPPYIPGYPSMEEDYIYFGGGRGVDTALRLVYMASRYGPDIYIILSSLGDIEFFRRVSSSLGFKVEVLDRLGIEGETLYLFRLSTS